ncbi:DUF3558 domain-containing protein [Crossiella cryophila]|uniref:DUF3558 domain-containing protein n=1 Tax=Crossiella cryophila TaxID=43355 RepID=A0A7W7FXY9_9PSEU|nr:DUF3558 domain-containing protein [Crossiella cryophila]MBB4681802.1 hypothetical protein [Crossiella cryophila]
MRDRSILVAVLAVGGLVLAGCTGNGTAMTSSASPTTTTKAAATLPPRPKTIPVAGLDSCGVLTADQQQQLQVDRKPRLSQPDQTDHLGNRSCSFDKSNQDPRFGLRVTPVPQEGAEVWLKGERNVKVKQVTAGGFGAVETRIGDNSTSCHVVVDVAPGQSLDVMGTALTKEAFTTDQTCEKARVAAEMVMQTLSVRG